MIRAARLVRVSSRGQAQDDRTSLPNQTRVLTELCQVRGWLSLEEDLFVEVISGAKGKEHREVLSRLLDQVTAGRYQRLCVLDFDRSTRKGLGEWEAISDILAAAGCLIVINGQEYDMDDSGAQLTTGIQAVVAKHERQKIIERVVRGMDAKAREGWNQGGRAPFGYRSYYPRAEGHKRPRKVVEIEPHEAQAIRLAFDLYLAGQGYQSIADELNRRGFRSPAGLVRWADIYRWTINPTYAGLYARRRPTSKKQQTSHLPGFMVPSQVYPAIVPIETWERCQAMRGSRKPHDHGSHRDRRPLSGILRCLSCGGPMLSFTRKFSLADGHEKRYHYYRCYRRMKHLGDCAAPQHLRQDLAHQAVLEGLRSLFTDLALPDDPDPEVLDQAEVEIRAGLLALDDEEATLLGYLHRPLEAGGIRADQFARSNQALLARRDTLEAQLRVLRIRRPRPKVDLPDVSAALAVMAPGDPALGDLLRAWFSEIRLAKEGGRGHGAKESLQVESAILLSGAEIKF